MAKGKSHHVVSNPDGGWDVKKGGSDRIAGHYNTKKEAIDKAREITRNQKSDLYIHDREGKIVGKDSYPISGRVGKGGRETDSTGPRKK